MADIKISQLGSAIAVGDTDVLPIVSGGNTLKATAAQVKEHSVGNTNISGIGDGSVTGAISSLNSGKQPKTLDTPLTIGGVSKTTVEAALDGLNSESQSLSTALANVKNGTTDIVQTSADGCTVVGGIGKNTYFYLDGELVRAKTAIANGASFTENTNYEVPNNGAYNEINSSVNTMQNNGLGTGVSILNYTSSNQYTTPSDGYFYLKSGDDINDYVIVEIGDRLDVGVKTQQAGYPEYNAIYVRKGVTAYVLAKSGSTVTAGFRPYQ